jgi:dihydrofolate synthase/folylpolyglutamate synthase
VVSLPVTRRRWTADDAERYLESLEMFGMRFGLERIRRLMTALGAPHERFSAVHVVGTNGKSSTARMIAAILTRNGLRVGAYLSPHLSSYAERIEVEGRAVAPERFGEAVQKAAQAAELVDRGLPAGEHVTQFEALTAAAYWALARAEVEAAVAEAGLGGRYDATSVIRSRVQVLTNVALEHTRWLGPTERHVAEEKLAVVPRGGRLVTGALGPEALDVAERTISERDASLLCAGRDFWLEGEDSERFTVVTGTRSYGDLALRPLGPFQRANFALALAAAEAFLPSGELDLEAVQAAAREVELPGRFEIVDSDPLVIRDGAHNPAAARALRMALEPLIGGRKLTAVLSVLDDKDAAGILSELLPLCERVVLTRSGHRRALPPAALESLCRQLSGPATEIVADPVRAVERARETAGARGAVLVTGSIYLLSDLVRYGAGGASQVA